MSVRYVMQQAGCNRLTHRLWERYTDGDSFDSVIGRILLFVVLLFLAGCLWLPFEGVARLSVLIALGLYLFISWRLREGENSVRRRGALMGATILVFVISQNSLNAGLYFTPLFLLLTMCVRSDTWRADDEGRRLLLISLSFVVIRLFVPEGWLYRFFDAISVHIYSISRIFVDAFPRYGPSYNGLYVVGSALVVLFWGIVFARKFRLRHLFGILFLVFLVFLQYWWNQKYLLVFLSFFAIGGLGSGMGGKTSVAPTNGLRPAVLIILLLGAGFLGSMCARRIPSPSARQVAFVGNVMGKWDLPVHERYGKDALPEGAQFGVFRSMFLRAYGFSEQPVDTLLEGDTGIVIVINPEKGFDRNVHNRIWRFVADGGSLLVLGDHTDIGGIRKPLNELLSPVGIEFEFDSAIPFDQGWNWFGCMRKVKHPILRRVRHEGHVEMSVGASLALRGAARPLLIGAQAFSDAGRPWYGESRLGNMVYDVGERYGDLVLVAESSHGRGKVVVFGDTSSFQSSSVSKSHYFLADLLYYLAGSFRAPFLHEHPVAGITGAVACIVLTIMMRNKRALGVVPLSVAVLAGAFFLIEESMCKEGLPENDVAVIDISHGTSFAMDNENEFGSEGLGFNILRGGYQPIIVERFDQRLFKSTSYYFICGPSRAFNADELHILEEYVKGGGNLILSAGRTGKYGGKGLLEKFGVAVGPVLGPAHTALSHLEKEGQEAIQQDLIDETDPQAQEFSDAVQKPQDAFVYRELDFYSAWGLIQLDKTSRVLCSAWDYPIILLKDFGAGMVCVIGDDCFLSNRNLEMPSRRRPKVNEKNIQLLRAILQEMNDKKNAP
ncbi:MAG: hypothetical protein JSU94_04785 [Phycisphaerales bacterium]|nr:MAG: hypothetical protein JSU94_04785 [Phycisphaerales bacterium]